MTKNLKKASAVFFAMMMSVAAVGCGESETEQQVDTTKAQLYVSNFSAGAGSKWLEKAIERFQIDYANEEFIPGTKGVQVWITPHRQGLDELGPKMATAKEEVYFLEYVPYYEGISKGYFLDITDMVTEDLTKYGESVSIEDKLYDSQVGYFKTPNGKYYGIPHTQSPTLITYDADLFDKKGYYFGADGKLGKKSTDSGLSNGPDGKAGTYDDGLPATYQQFYELCERMTKQNVAPLIWSGTYPWYTTRFARSVKADFEGEEHMLSYTFNGTATHLVDSIDAQGNVTYKEPTQITEENGYEIFSSAGYYYTYEFFEGIYKNGYYSNKAFNEGTTHTGAQELFLVSSFTSAQDIAMLVEGTYWVNESLATFDEMAVSINPDAALEKRNLKVMPLPKARDNLVGTQATYVDCLNELAFISAYVKEEKKELAKTFLQYCETQKSLEEFIQTTKLPRCYDIDYSNVYDSLCPFSKSIVDSLKGANYLMPNSSSQVFLNNYTEFFETYEFGTKEQANPMWGIKNGKTALQLFGAMKNKYTQSSWNVLLNK